MQAASAFLMVVTLLGTGNPRPELDRFGPSILVEAGGHRLLFDCGRGATQRLFALDALTKVESVLFTHLHSDHVTGFPDFWLTGWLFGRASPLHVWGPSGTTSMIRNVERAYEFDVKTRSTDEGLPAPGVKIIAADVNEGVIPGVPEGWKITAFTVDHGPVKPALGYRIDYGGYSVVLSGDTRPSENLLKYAMGADVLIHEVLAPEVERRRARMADPKAVQRVIEHHTTSEEVGEIFRKAHPRIGVLSHIVPSVATEADVMPDVRKHYAGRVAWGVDGMTIRVGKEIEVLK